MAGATKMPPVVIFFSSTSFLKLDAADIKNRSKFASKSELSTIAQHEFRQTLTSKKSF